MGGNIANPVIGLPHSLLARRLILNSSTGDPKSFCGAFGLRLGFEEWEGAFKPISCWNQRIHEHRGVDLYLRFIQRRPATLKMARLTRQDFALIRPQMIFVLSARSQSLRIGRIVERTDTRVKYYAGVVLRTVACGLLSGVFVPRCAFDLALGGQ